MIWKSGVVAELIEEDTALLSAVVHSAAYVVYKDDREDCVNVMRLRLDRRLVIRLPLAQRTKTFTNGDDGRT